MTPAPPVTLTAEIRLDQLAKALTGRERGGGLERLLAANPGLAAAGSYAPEGATVVAPEAPAATPVLPSVNPWE